MTLIRVAIGLAALLYAAGFAVGSDEAPELAKPDVNMNADPEPPFTYWAPQGSSIVNHPRVDGVWIAETEGKPPVYYFGDMCKASEFQDHVGQAKDRLPTQPDNENWRFICSECEVLSDLHYDRMNIIFDEDSSLIESIACG